MYEPLRVVITNGVVKTRFLTIPSVDVADWLEDMPPDDWEASLVRAVELGVVALRHAGADHVAQTFRRAAEKLTEEVAARVSALPAALTDGLAAQLGVDEGQALAPVANLCAEVQAVLTERLESVRKLLDQHVDPRRPDTTLGAAIDSLKRRTDPRWEGSIQACLQKAVESVAGADGALAGTVQKVLGAEMARLREELDRLAKEVRGGKSADQALLATPAKGPVFELEVLAAVKVWAAALGAEVHHTGPENRPGDVVVELPAEGDGAEAAPPLRLVIESRDDAERRGRRRVLADMDPAMQQRSAGWGIYVGRTESALAAEIGEWAELSGQQGPVVACTAHHLRTALRFAVAGHRLQRLRRSRPGPDAAAAESALSRVRNSLLRVRRIHSALTAVRNSADAAGREADSLRREAGEALDSAEAALRLPAAAPVANEIDRRSGGSAGLSEGSARIISS